METDIDVMPTWDASVALYLEVLRVNEWDSEPSKQAREDIFKMAETMDSLYKYVKEVIKHNDSIK